MVAKKTRKKIDKKNDTSSAKPARRPGFLVDFSLYRDEHWSIEEAYTDATLINKIGDFMKALLWAENPLRCNLGLKMEPLNPGQDKKIINKCNFDKGPLYYASFSGQARGFVFGLDSTMRRAYILGASKRHVFRPYHGQYD